MADLNPFSSKKPKQKYDTISGFDKTNVATFLNYGAQLSTDTMDNPLSLPPLQTVDLFSSTKYGYTDDKKDYNASIRSKLSDKSQEEMETLLSAFQSREETIKRRKKQPGRSQLLFAGR